jgi:hypothetical protein
LRRFEPESGLAPVAEQTRWKQEQCAQKAEQRFDAHTDQADRE